MAVAICQAANAQDIRTNDINQATLQELGRIRVALERIAENLGQLTTNETQRRAFSKAYLGDDAFQARGPDLEQLSRIKLPEPADPAQVRKYIRAIVAASQGQNSWSDRDPQVAMLTKVGTANIPLLIEALSLNGAPSDTHIVKAVVILADDTSKPVILEALPIHHDLVTAVIKRGWEKDAQPILLTELKNAGEFLPEEWIQAVVNLNDPESFPLLRTYFINGMNNANTYNMIKRLPIQDLPAAVAEAWKRCKYENVYLRQGMAIVALEYGHVDALASLIDLLASGEMNLPEWSNQVRSAVLKYVEFRGSNEDLVQWFQKNRDKLRFDPKAKKFVTDE